jgi:hypothetical protein
MDNNIIDENELNRRREIRKLLTINKAQLIAAIDKLTEDEVTLLGMPIQGLIFKQMGWE